MTGVDVVVPCYNYGRYLEWCVGTLLDQPGVAVRVLVIDDASTDDSQAVGERLAAADPRVEYRRHAKNAGHIATYNEGLLGWASAAYSLLISADDALAPGALARATALMDARPDVGMTYGMATVITDERGPDTGTAASDEQRILPGADFLEYCCRVGNPVPTPAAVVRTRLQQRLGGYRPDLPHSGDMEMWMRFAFDGPIGILRAVQAYYRWHGRNMSTGYYARLLNDRRERVLACRQFESRTETAIPGYGSWVTSMCDRLGQEAFWLAYDAFEAGDARGCRECLAFAADASPALARSGPWKKMRLKQWIGPALWRRLGPVFERLRGGTREPPSSFRTGATYNPGQSIGWWPDAARPSGVASQE